MFLLRVHAGSHARRACPLAVAVGLEPAQPVALYQQPGRRPRFCQLEATPEGASVRWMLPRLEAGAVMEYLLVPLPSRKKPAARLRWQGDQANHLQVSLDGHAFAVFDGRDSQPFPGLHPVYAPGQLPEQVAIAGLWLTAEGLQPPHHRTELRLINEPVEGPVFARLETHGLWRSAQDEQLLEEFVGYTFYATPDNLRLVDLAVSLRASFGPASLAGGPVRIRLEQELKKAAALTHRSSEGGIGLREVEGRKAAWVQTAGRTSVAVFDHPENVAGPCRWRLDDGLSLSPEPFAKRKLELAAGEVVTLRYRLCLQAQDPDGEDARQHYLSYVFPPHVEVWELP